MITIGLMSGTSLDGVDAVVCSFKRKIASVSIDFLAHEKISYSSNLRSRLLAVSEGGGGAAEICELNIKVGKVFARAAKKVMESKSLAGKKIAVIGSHGQTIRHDPKKRATMQIGDPAVIVANTGLPVWADFRSADMARGGEGAPLAPVIHLPLFGKKNSNVAVVNIGGIANLTFIPTGATSLADVTAYDTGPGNMLIDFVAARIGLKGGYDRDGKMAASGSVDNKLLARLLAHSYFKRRPPKSTGREIFGQSFLSWAKMADPSNAFDRDTMATITELTATTIVKEITKCARGYQAPLEIILTGGGSRNKLLVRRIQSLAGTSSVVATSDEKGAPSQMVEGALMALLAYYSEMGMRLDMSSVTGAAPGVVTLGARYPV